VVLGVVGFGEKKIKRGGIGDDDDGRDVWVINFLWFL
jgi:hypothetical protein